MTIRTERLTLRPWVEEDLKPFAELNADIRVREHFPSVLTPEESNEMAKKMQAKISERGWGCWAVSLNENGKFIGFIGLDEVSFQSHFTPAVEIGWRLAYEHWGKGYATEGALACLKFAFETLKLIEVVSFTALQNFKSMAVMKKIGMHRDPKDDFDHPKVPEGHRLQRHALYRLRRDEWHLRMYSPEMQQQVKDSLELLKTVLGPDLLAVYLFGSSLVGGLQKYSDIDLFVVANRTTTADEKNKLIANLLQISGIYMKSSKFPIEMTIVEKGAINPWRYPPHFDFQYGEWLRESFEKGIIEPPSSQEMPDLALIVTQILLKSQTLWGSEPGQLLASVPYHDFIKAMLQDLNRLGSDLEHDTRNVLLTYARIWSTLETNAIRSKPAAADWVMNHLPEEYQPVMRRAKSICTGIENEHWDDIKALIKPCADFMVEKINAQVLLINFDYPNNAIKLAEDSHEQMINMIISAKFMQLPKFIKRMTIGISNEVYEVGLNDKNVFVRLSPSDKFLMGSHDHIPKFKALGIKVPEILAEDYTRGMIPLSYQVQSKIIGKDLGEVIETLSNEQLRELAKEVSNIFKKVGTIPSSDKYGVIWGGGDNEVSDTWTERMQIWIDESQERGLKTGVMDFEMETIARNLYKRYRPYFDKVKPTTYYGDISSKNIMIHEGAFNGLVDLDGLTQGDPLEAIGRIKLAWYGTRHGEIYTEALMSELSLDPEQRKIVTMYALLNKISWTCENGIQFNLNTRSEVDHEKKRRDIEVIKKLVGELW